MSQTPVPQTTGTALFQFPPHYSFPPFFTLQPNPLTRSSQLSSWSSLILSYCRHQHVFTLTLIDALETPLFKNKVLGKQLSLRDAREVLNWMAGKEGGERIEWIGSGKGKPVEGSGMVRCWVYWRRPEEWASVVADWVSRCPRCTFESGVIDLCDRSKLRDRRAMFSHSTN
jgi:ESCRT-II complex subunit VPS25